ncbi:MAG: DUF3427 domain-containing protein [Spirochaetales bacterium]|nr:DUF3427 domain-containing protein [Spirochaetales bacterium]
MSLKPGIYEQIVNEETEEKLSGISKDNKKLEKIDSGTSSIVLSQYVKDIVRKALEKTDNLDKQVKLANEIIDMVSDKVRTEDLKEKRISTDGNTLLEVKDPVSKLVVNSKNRPATSLTHSYLFTGDVDMPLINELKREIATSDSVDMLISFLKVSGLAMIREALKAFFARGGRLRIITTTYMGATDAMAIKELAGYPNTEIHISYDSQHTRLHAKSYIFHRSTGFHTAYIGSSNLSKAAITDGREWNVKITSHDQPDVFDQMNETFEIYWNSIDFEKFDLSKKEKLEKAIAFEQGKQKRQGKQPEQYMFDIKGFPFQDKILDQLAAERRIHGNTRNLVVAATGTGKTVIAALDYRRFRKENAGKNTRLLFVAHREEILSQSLSCFRSVLRDPNFGDMLVGKYLPTQRGGSLFASIQSINSKDFVHTFRPDEFAFIIIDEFHHAAARSYQDLLTYFKPNILLGLTATPERMDGEDILKYFDGEHIAAEIRLPEAIERQLLCPFHYYGVDDGTDLRSLKWSVGGYDKSELENVYVLSRTAAERRAQLIVNSIYRYVGDPLSVKCIGFCVSIAHADFMAEYFNSHYIPSISLSSRSSSDERANAKSLLESGKINYIFVVDLYNEGVDIPDIDMVMFLRPTESLTIFLQQLGRGLRVSEGKEFLTVLDFIGQSNKKYRFEEKFKALLENTKRGVLSEIKEGFVSVPKGCYIELEKKPEEIILANIRSQLGTRDAIIEKIRSFQSDSGLSLTLEHFLGYTKIPVRELYRFGSFNKLCIAAGLRKDSYEKLDTVMETAFPKFAFADSRRWIKFLLRCLQSPSDIHEYACDREEKSLLDMFMFTLYMIPESGMTAERAINEVRRCPAIRQELVELLEYKLQNINFIDEPVRIEKGNVLDCYCTYSRDQILASLGMYSPNTVRQGVFYVKDKMTDVFFVTLNKSEKEFSPTTLYSDYSISSTKFHWQSQSTTSEKSPTGQRYIRHKEMGTNVFLFVREKKKDQFGACPYTFLGAVDFVSSEGSYPMNIIWELQHPIPARFIKETSRGIAL